MSDTTLKIGIGGVSRSFKTTLSRFLAQRFSQQGLSVRVLHQDDFVFPKNQIPLIKGVIDWEHPESIDFEKYHKAIVDANHFDVIIAEGLLNFYDKKVTRLFHKKIFCEIPKEIFIKRKLQDKRWGKTSDWYIQHIWESYERYGKTIFSQNEDFLKINCKNKVDFKKAWHFVAPQVAVGS